MNKKTDHVGPDLDRGILDERRRKSLVDKCSELREKIRLNDPVELARRCALSIHYDYNGELSLVGDYLKESCLIRWPALKIEYGTGALVPLRVEALWLHYLERADGYPLTGRWVNLSEIGGLFYQQAFQGYCGNHLADFWGDNIQGLASACREIGGWPVQGLADLAFEWRVLPRLLLCLCYRKSYPGQNAWASMLFDASTNHYVAADVAATTGKELASRLTV